MILHNSEAPTKAHASYYCCSHHTSRHAGFCGTARRIIPRVRYCHFFVQVLEAGAFSSLLFFTQITDQ